MTGHRIQALLAMIALTIVVSPALAEKKIKALIVDGANNHGVWPQTTKMMKRYLEETKLFTVDVATRKQRGRDPEYKPAFDKYKVVISNYNGPAWPAATKKAFVSYMKNGGGFVVVHAANNAFGRWKEYNEIIGLGGWGGRNEKSGPYVYINAKGELKRDESKGRGGNHGPQHPFQIIVRNSDHPVTKGMPTSWMHSRDELYDLLRGPAENMTILATAFAAKSKGGRGRHEPMIFTVTYGKGRVFHTPMGHGIVSQRCAGFIATLQRGAEWAATNKVTQKIPKDFPSSDKVTLRKK